MLIRALILIAVIAACSLAAPGENPVAGRWAGRSPDPIGRTEEVELRFTVTDAGLTGMLVTPDHQFPVAKIQLHGQRLTFDVTRELRGRNIVYHYDGWLSEETLAFTVQNDDGSSFFRFATHRAR